MTQLSLAGMHFFCIKERGLQRCTCIYACGVGMKEEKKRQTEKREMKDWPNFMSNSYLKDSLNSRFQFL